MGLFRKQYNDWGDRRFDWHNILLVLFGAVLGTGIMLIVMSIL